MHDAGALKKTTFAVHNRMFPRAAGVNPPCFAIRTLCRENHALFADRATLNRSGTHQPAVASGIALATATGFRERITFALHIRLPHHGWLTPAAPDARRRCTEKNDIRGAQSHVPKSGARQPAVVCYKNAVPQESTHY
jgi:hypothetical protein